MDFTLREWVRMARQHGSIAQAAVFAQAAESGVSEDVIRGTMVHHLHCMQEAVRTGLDEKLRSVSGLTGGQASLIARVLYTVIGAAGVWSISMLFTSREARTENHEMRIDGANA